MTAIKLFVKPRCALCPQAIALLETADLATRPGLTVTKYDVSTDVGLAEAAFHEVLATPTILVLDDDEMEIGGWRGEVPPLTQFQQILDR